MLIDRSSQPILSQDGEILPVYSVISIEVCPEAQRDIQNA
jgi:hypothetical protein